MLQLNIEFDMTNLSITIPDDIAKASNEVAKKLGLSRTAFIRQAIIHELDNLQSKFEQEGIIKSFNAMKKSPQYLEEAEEIMNGLNSELPEEDEKWWVKKKY
ncbi:MAG TPA: ribbon-helix-helix domain-containing protein [Rickettsia endosymbiont of Degeeriella rufa]|nr:ribbon-helix-helix domain-containing protein [Rickettsia endosymbiont of Degeeriella rufa]HJD67896.1 ribbon-helix-helix domain-containing protein [Rickettsia endosymbiont of Bembidion lapponicum]